MILGEIRPAGRMGVLNLRSAILETTNYMTDSQWAPEMRLGKWRPENYNKRVAKLTYFTDQNMSPVKESAIRLIEALPDDCTLDDIHYHRYVREKIEHGLAAIDAGQIVTQEEAEGRIAEWAASSGQNPH